MGWWSATSAAGGTTWHACLKVELGPLDRSLGTMAAHSGWQLAVKLLVWVLPEVATPMRPRTASQCRVPQRMADGPKMAS